MRAGVYSLRAEPLAEVDEWLGRYRVLWENRLDALHTEIARARGRRRVSSGLEPRSVQWKDFEAWKPPCPAGCSTRRFRGHPWFDATVEFCERYDENCFDPAYEWLPLEHFAPAVVEVFSREPSFR